MRCGVGMEGCRVGGNNATRGESGRTDLERKECETEEAAPSGRGKRRSAEGLSRLKRMLEASGILTRSEQRSRAKQMCRCLWAHPS